MGLFLQEVDKCVAIVKEMNDIQQETSQKATLLMLKARQLARITNELENRLLNEESYVLIVILIIYFFQLFGF